MSTVRSYRDLIVWQLAMQLGKGIYELTRDFPRDELYGLTSQLRRAAVSIPSNIAEGHARDSRKEYLHHVSIAMGSLAEIETQLMFTVDLQYCDQSRINGLLEQADMLGRKLRGLQKSLKTGVE